MIIIRKALLADLPFITAIYNKAVLNTTATFDLEVKTLEDRVGWFSNRGENFPIIVAEKQEKVVGYASLSKWSDKKGYDITAEISVYVHEDHQGVGVGKRLIEIIVKMAKETALHSIIARITEGNEKSIYLHKLQGFEVVGVLRNVGKKFGKLLDVTLMQCLLK